MKPMNIMNPPKIRMITPAGRPSDAGRIDEHRVHEAGRRDEQEAGQADRQEADDVARQALLRGQGPDLALDADALADGVRDRVEDLGEVAADLVLDGDGRGHQLEVVRADAPDHVLERLLERQAEVDLADDPAELGRDRRPRLAHDQLDGLQERRAGAQRVGDQGDRVRQLLVEGVEPAALAAVEPEAREPEADERADQPHERAAEAPGRTATARSSTAGMPRVEPAQMTRNSDGLSLRSARAMSRARLAPKSRCSTTLLRLASASLWAMRSLIGPWPVDAAFASGLPGGVALEAVGDARASGARDTDRDEQDGQRGDARHREGHDVHGRSASPRPST